MDLNISIKYLFAHLQYLSFLILNYLTKYKILALRKEIKDLKLKFYIGLYKNKIESSLLVYIQQLYYFLTFNLINSVLISILKFVFENKTDQTKFDSTYNIDLFRNTYKYVLLKDLYVVY
ncbi:hypothetical protein EDEG_00096 [Edhazardia aedis USNM 41457]|uniref:Uncharacterized protein n=1 Tax=Edhazardia aedis (strain USNM 41457) TaxID=1003232 RepID=J9DBW0_EDHAE|nr:hypothetical protein EDEG_00096 [Edhazardia aedis USNM 41457]|eukprot:EJW04979.1 hypothetical protein EDEG_00096 [Edhazardia aedis USNM 41457]